MPIKTLLNGEVFIIPSEMTVRELLHMQKLEINAVAVAIDESFVPRHAYATTNITQGANIEIIAPMQGG